MARRAFTVEEANHLLPAVRAAIEIIRDRRLEALEHHEKLQVLDALWGERVARPENPDHGEFEQHRTEIERAARDIERLVQERLIARGIRFPVGGLEHGLVDFPTTLDGRWVYLCWRYGEPEVGFWHEVDGGFRGRRPLSDAVRSRMGRPDDPALGEDPPLDR